jgi:hypothetical protein
MRRRQLLAVALCSFLGIACAQDSTSPPNFAGTWQASFKGAVFCTLKINAGAEISGTLSPGKVTVDDDGDLTEAEPSSPDGAFPILNPKIDGKTLSFGWKESSDDELLKFEFKLTGESEAELRLINEDNIKPIRLQRAAELRQ